MTQAGVPAGAPSLFDVLLVDLGLRRGHEINERSPVPVHVVHPGTGAIGVLVRMFAP